MSTESTPEALNRFEQILEREGIIPALRYLNGLGPHRFTAIYRRDAGTMRNLYLIDREDLSITRSDDIPFTSTYCQFAMASGDAFVTDDALQDARLQQHPARAQVRSYCGVPLLDELGRATGSLCSFDYAPMPSAGLDLELLLQLPPMLRRHRVPCF